MGQRCSDNKNFKIIKLKYLAKGKSGCRKHLRQDQIETLPVRVKASQLNTNNLKFKITIPVKFHR